MDNMTRHKREYIWKVFATRNTKSIISLVFIMFLAASTLPEQAWTLLVFSYLTAKLNKGLAGTSGATSQICIPRELRKGKQIRVLHFISEYVGCLFSVTIKYDGLEVGICIFLRIFCMGKCVKCNKRLL